MKKIGLISILIVALAGLSGCSFTYEEYHTHRRRRPVVCAPPPPGVIEVVPVPPYRHPHRRPPRPPW